MKESDRQFMAKTQVGELPAKVKAFSKAEVKTITASVNTLCGPCIGVFSKRKKLG